MFCGYLGKKGFKQHVETFFRVFKAMGINMDPKNGLTGQKLRENLPLNFFRTYLGLYQHHVDGVLGSLCMT